MKTHRSVSICSFAAPLILLFAAFPCAATQQQWNYHTNWQLPRLPVSLNHATLEIKLVEVPANVTWVLGVHTDASAKPTMALGAGELRDSPRGSRYVERMEAVSAPNYTTRDGMLEVKFPAAEKQNALMVYVIVPPQTVVRWSVNGKPVSEKSVSESLLVRNGETLDTPVRNMNPLVLALTGRTLQPGPKR